MVIMYKVLILGLELLYLRKALRSRFNKDWFSNAGTRLAEGTAWTYSSSWQSPFKPSHCHRSVILEIKCALVLYLFNWQMSSAIEQRYRVVLHIFFQIKSEQNTKKTFGNGRRARFAPSAQHWMLCHIQENTTAREEITDLFETSVNSLNFCSHHISESVW